MEYDRIFSGFTMCNLLGETRYYGNNFVIAYWYFYLYKWNSIICSPSVSFADSSRCGSVTPRVWQSPGLSDPRCRFATSSEGAKISKCEHWFSKYRAIVNSLNSIYICNVRTNSLPPSEWGNTCFAAEHALAWRRERTQLIIFKVQNGEQWSLRSKSSSLRFTKGGR